MNWKTIGALLFLLPSVALAQTPGDTFGGGGGGPGSGGAVDTIVGTADIVVTGGAANKTIALGTTTVSAGTCTNCNLDIDANGRITSQATGAGGPGGGATTETSGVVHPTTTPATTDFAVGGTDATAQFFFDAGTGTLTLNEPGAGITVAPHGTDGAALVLSEGANPPTGTGGNVFRLEVNSTTGLASNVTCTLDNLGQLDAGCPLIANLGGAPSAISNLTDVDTITPAPNGGDVLTWDGISEWNAAAPAAPAAGASTVGGLTDVIDSASASVPASYAPPAGTFLQNAPNPGTVNLVLSWNGFEWVPRAEGVPLTQAPDTLILSPVSQTPVYEMSGSVFEDPLDVCTGPPAGGTLGSCYQPLKVDYFEAANGNITLLAPAGSSAAQILTPDGTFLNDCRFNGLGNSPGGVINSYCNSRFRLTPPAGTPAGQAVTATFTLRMTGGSLDQPGQVPAGVRRCTATLYQDNNIVVLGPHLHSPGGGGPDIVATGTDQVCDNTGAASCQQDNAVYGLYLGATCNPSGSTGSLYDGVIELEINL